MSRSASAPPAGLAGRSVDRAEVLFRAAGHLCRSDRDQYGFSRADVDAYAVESQKRTAKSWEDGPLQELGDRVKDVNG